MSLIDAVRKVLDTSPGQQMSVREATRALKLQSPISLRNFIRLVNLPPPGIQSFRAQPMNVNPNSESTLSWTVINCENSCSIRITKRIPGVGDNIPVASDLPPISSLTVTVTAGTFYKLTASFPKKPVASRTTSVGIIGPAGFSRIVVMNSHTEGRSVNVWIIDHNTGSSEDKGSLQAGQSKSITLENGHTFDLVCVDQGAIGCTVDDPNIVSCRRLFVPNIIGNENGGTLQEVVN